MDDREALPPLPILPEDILVEILQRLPPEPIYLFRASLVSKHWRGLIHDAGFLRHFRDFHGGTPPVPGFFNNQPGHPLFVRTATASATSTVDDAGGGWWALDCRHGLALLERHDHWALSVWDLVTGDKQYLPMPPAPTFEGLWNGAVLRAAGHGNRSSGPFLVVYVCTTYVSSSSNAVTCACVYSSDTGVWSEITSIILPYSMVDVKPTALVGKTLYWLSDNCCIFEFDLDNHRLGLIGWIPLDEVYSYGHQIVIMPTQDGLLGLAGVEGFDLHLWLMVKSAHDKVTWTRQRVIDLKKLLAPEVVATCTVRVWPIGFAEEAGVILIAVYPSVYMIHLKSMQIEEVPEKGSYGSIILYASFYSPAPGLPRLSVCCRDRERAYLFRFFN